MNEIRRVDRTAEEIARIREIVGHRAFPDYVTGFDVELGEYYDEPAAWITLRLTGDHPVQWDERKARADAMRLLIHGLTSDLLAADDSRYPYFRMSRDRQSPPQAS